MDHSFVQINSYFHERYVSLLSAILRISWLIKYLNSAVCHSELPKQRNIAKWKACSYVFVLIFSSI